MPGRMIGRLARLAMLPAHCWRPARACAPWRHPQGWRARAAEWRVQHGCCRV